MSMRALIHRWRAEALKHCRAALELERGVDQQEVMLHNEAAAYLTRCAQELENELRKVEANHADA